MTKVKVFVFGRRQQRQLRHRRRQGYENESENYKKNIKKWKDYAR